MINQRYSLVRKLGQGRSSVYLCKDTETADSAFAIKILPPDADELEKENFIREFFILRKLDHPNIIKSYETGTAVHVDGSDEIQAGSFFITLEYFDSGELLDSELIRHEKTLKLVTAQICSALYYLHQSRYIYYDLKPENILVAERNGMPVVKLIDLGLAEYSPHKEKYSVKGTAQYIAPELLKKEPHNHSVDLYSLGMLLYRVIYNRFPFDTNNELEIYKEQIESEFDFITTANYSETMINITKKLLSKNPADRYASALEVLADLDTEEELNFNADFTPAKILCGRENELMYLHNYVNDKSGSEIVSVKGFDSTGKTALLNKLNEIYPDSVLINDLKGKTGIDLVKYVLCRIIFSASVFPHLDGKSKKEVLKYINNAGIDLSTSLKSLAALLSSVRTYVVLIDNFNLFDEFAGALLREIIPVLQINNIKVIVSESSEKPYSSDKLFNVRDIILGPFTENQLDEFIEKSFIDNFPKNELKKLIQLHSDFIPGNLVSFIKDLIRFEILRFSGSSVGITDDESKLSFLKQSQSAIYDLRLANLSEKELNALKILAAFDIVIDVQILALLIGSSTGEAEKIIGNLQLNNLLLHYTYSQSLLFTSDSLKKHVYSTIIDKEAHHLAIAEKLSRLLPSFNRSELARHFELAGKHELCYQVLEAELTEAEKLSAFTYMKNILEHLVQLKLDVIPMNKIKIKLSEIYYKLSDFNSAIKTIRSLQELELNVETINNVRTIEAGSLIGIGDFESGKEILNGLLERIEDQHEKNRLMVELAYADFELKNYEEAESRCDLVLEEMGLSPELKGRCYNLKGMRRIYQDNDLNSAIVEFDKALISFKEADSPRRVAGMEVNIGNIFTLLSDYKSAETHWKNALEINRSVGNLEQEGLILLNLGISYYFRGRFDQAIESYKKAKKIFLNTGHYTNLGLVLLNLGEVYLTVCEYQNSFDSLEEARQLFTSIENFEELAEVLLMFGKLYFVIGFRDKVAEVLEKYKANLEVNKLPGKYDLNLKYLRLLLKYSDGNKIPDDELTAVRDEYKSYDDKSGYIDSSFLLIRNLVYEENFQEALSVLNQKFLIDLCLQNSILEAEREYFLGMISQKYASDKILPPLEHFEKAYALVKEGSISEITWKILLAISEVYIERGNLSKAKSFTIYGRELIHFIADRIESPRLRAAYLKQKERLQALKKFESFYPA